MNYAEKLVEKLMQCLRSVNRNKTKVNGIN